MQTSMNLTQGAQQSVIASRRLSSSPVVSQPLSFNRARCTSRQAPTAPQAYVRGYWGGHRGARQSQQILEQMLREVAACSSPASAPAKDLDLPLAVDSSSEDDAYVFYADIPGVKRDDLKVQTKDHKLTISGKRERSSKQNDSSTAGRQRLERRFGRFSRQIRLPEDADCNSIKAKVDNGVLTVSVAKLSKLPGVEDVEVDF